MTMMMQKPLFVEHINASLNTQPYNRLLEEYGLRRALYLDIGAGIGQNVLYTKSLGLTSFALEYDPDYVARIPAARVARGVADQLPYRSESFDIVSLMHVLEHLPSFRQTLDEIRRVIKPGGYFLVEVPNKCTLQELFNFLYVRYFLDPSNKHLGHCNFFDYKSLKVLLESHGFEIIDQRMTGGLLSSNFNSIIINSLRLSRRLVKQKGLDSYDYESINSIQRKINFQKLERMDRWINRHTLQFVEFLGFICISNK